MARNPYFDILFEPVKIGPVTTKNRFYQVPHATAHGYKMPNSHAGVRGVKAEGGWGVVNTEYCSIHPTSDDTPYPQANIWDDADIAAHALIAEKLIEQGCRIDFVSTYSNVAAWTQHTVEQERIQARMINLGINIIPSRNLKAFDGNRVTLECVYTGSEEEMQVDGLVMITARVPNDDLYYELESQAEALSAAGIKSLARIGDCLAPGTIANAVFSGHKFAREFDEPDPGDVPFKRERNVLEL